MRKISRNFELLTQCARARQSAHGMLATIITTARRHIAEQSSIVDIDADAMMMAEETINATDLDGAALAPIDIDAWASEDEAKQGTVDIDMDKKIFEYPPIPEKRTNVFVFRGIKVVLPDRMLRPQTYRYRLDKEDQDSLADDIRVCKFPKLKRKIVLAEK